eukprot:CAMPEP_0119315466 /NCGR_PEP_ID=MMETSP1333-20130426/36017_1 /TAXON_ID=418940 /ORGANISM="Scyphosphaera apsteinii, Strain RCC1455" /LENGTH=43 /DNA_ID= /DNA_START= /DNA_END= /DNA_ORIENTATION=
MGIENEQRVWAESMGRALVRTKAGAMAGAKAGLLVAWDDSGME